MPIILSNLIPGFPFLSSICLCKLCNKHYDCLSQCKRQEIARNSEKLYIYSFLLSINSILCCSHIAGKHCFVVFTASRFPYMVLWPNLMTVLTSKGKVPPTYNELIRRIMTLVYENLLLLESPEIKSNIAITGKKQQGRDIKYAGGILR